MLAAVLAPCFVARIFLQPRYVAAAAPQQQAGRQFKLDLGLFLLAGAAISLVNLWHYGFPLISSGSKLVLSLGAVGLFAALDLALARERMLIRRAKELGLSLHPPKEFTPLTRKFSLLATTIMLLVTVSMMLLFLRDIVWLAGELTSGTGGVLEVGKMKREVFIEVGFVMAVLLLLTIRAIVSYSGNLQLFFRNETHVLEQVSNGVLEDSVPVLTNDEFGFIAGHTNSMIEGLRDRMRMRQGLIVAREVQQNLLPGNAPQLPRVRIFGRSHYSDETGGDFYDFYENAGPEGRHVGVVVGDVSGHGVGPALLMATARAMFRLRMGQGCELAQCLSDVNSQLARDLFGSGRFMTLQALLVHKETGELTICTAGHDPALVYDSQSDTFGEISSSGLPLGVDAEWRYESRQRPPLQPGELLLVGTDGIWETQSPQGEMFGKERLCALLRQFGQEIQTEGPQAAEDMDRLDARILAALAEHRGQERPEDDITMVLLQGKVAQ